MKIKQFLQSPPSVVSGCFVSTKFGPLMIFLKRWFGYNKTKHYEKSLDLWKDVDPGIARKRLAGLK